MRVLITGGSGFVGSHLARHYLVNGHKVFITGTYDENDPNCESVGYDFAKIDWAGLPPIDMLFHQAAITDTTIHDRDEMFKVNFWRSRQLFDEAISRGVSKIIYASSAAVYGDNQGEFYEDKPGKCLNVYAESKLLLDRYAEILHKTHPEVSLIGLRYSNVYGPDEQHKGKSCSMVTQLYEQMLSGRPKLFKYGEQRRDFVYVEDAVQANILAAKSNEKGVFNVGSGTATSFNEVVETLNSVLETDWVPEYCDNPIQAFYQDFTLLNLDKSHEILGYWPAYNIVQGIKKMTPSLAS